MFAKAYHQFKPFLKLALALGILFGLVGWIFYAQKQAEIQYKTFEETKDDATFSSDTVVNDYELKEVDGNQQKQWELTAKKGIREKTTKDVKLEKVEVKYYNEGKLSLQLSAPVGQANEISRKVTLTSNETQKVKGIGVEKQTSIETKEMVLTKNNQFKASGGVNIEWPGVAKVKGNSAEGVMSATQFIEQLVIRGNTHAQLKM